jgi:7-cyano-7-deazaguanine synthase
MSTEPRIVRPNIVLLSGGLDSTTVLGLQIQKHQANVSALVFRYGQKHQIEIAHAMSIAKYYGIACHIMDIPKHFFATHNSALVGEREIPNVSYDKLTGVSPTYVPFRNGTLLSIATAFVMANNPEKECTIAIGVHADDAAGDAYPDCSVDFILAMQSAIRLGTYNKVELLAPYVRYDKAQIVRDGYRMDVPYNLTWSCYQGGVTHCGICPTCRARQQAFEAARVPDPTMYQEYPTDEE